MIAGWRRRAGRGDERGASAVEFALILPVLVLFIGAIIDFGFIFSQQITMNNAARDAARAGVVTNLSGATMNCGQLAQQARNAMTGGAVGISNANKVNVGVTIVGQAGTCSLPAGSTTTSNAGLTPCTNSNNLLALKNLQVTVSYASSTPFPVPFMGTVPLSARGDFQCEYT